LVPELVPKLTRLGISVAIQTGAGLAAGFPDQSYVEKGAQIEPEVLAQADVVLKVRRPSVEEIANFRPDSTRSAFSNPTRQTRHSNDSPSTALRHLQWNSCRA
jgi:NAD(P) transhydrogenase subunit alpha